MKSSQHEPHRVGYSSLVGSLAVILLSALAVHAQPTVTRRFTVTQDATGRGEVALNSPCTAANFNLKLSENKFFQMEEPNPVLLQPTARLVGFRINAIKVPGEYSDVLTITCLDCQKTPGCSQSNREVLILLTVTPKQRDVSGNKITDAEIEAAVKDALTQLDEEVRRRAERLKEKTGRREDGKPVTGYDADVVEQLFEWIELQLLTIFEREGLFAMRDYVEKNYHQPSPLDVVPIIIQGGRLLPAPGGVFSAPALGFRAVGGRSTGSLITTTSAAKSLKYARSFIRFAMKNSGPRTLIVRSKPDLANVVLVAGEKKYEFATNNNLSGFWPGLYHLKVTKSGFVPIEQSEMDLVLNDTIECTLVKTGEAIFCQIK